MHLAGGSIFLGVDSFSIIFNHRSFRKPAAFRVLGVLFERRMPGKNGEGTPRIFLAFVEGTCETHDHQTTGLQTIGGKPRCGG